MKLLEVLATGMELGGFPVAKGGPVYWARSPGRAELATDMRELASSCGHGFVAGNLDLLLRTD